MITYDKGWWGNRVLFRAYGSAFPRAMPPAILAAAIAAVVSALFDTEDWELFRNAYPLQLFFFIVGFMVIFRCAVEFNRFSTRLAMQYSLTAVRHSASNLEQANISYATKCRGLFDISRYT